MGGPKPLLAPPPKRKFGGGQCPSFLQAADPMAANAICCESIISVTNGCTDTQCCGRKAYDSSKEICCDRILSDSSGFLNPQCCGREAYDTNKEICCEQRLSDINDFKNSSCCGKKGYDNTKEICCGRKTSSIENFINPDCCGRQAYDKNMFYCIDGRLVSKYKKFIDQQRIFNPNANNCSKITNSQDN